MSGFNWDDHPIVTAGKPAQSFSWNDHPIVKPAEKGLVDTAVDAVSAAGKFIDSYTGAPSRAAVVAAQDGKNPIPAFTQQFGENPDTAPTGKQIAIKAGISDQKTKSMSAAEKQAFDEKYNPGLAATMKAGGKKYEDVVSPSPADVAGVGFDLASDYTNAIPLVGAAKALKPAAEAVTEGAKVASKSGVIESLATKLKNFAEKSAVNATGATGKQATKFADNAGRELLDRGIVKFGDNQAKIAERAGEAVDAANKQIDTALSKLAKSGVTIDRNTIYNTVRDTINTMKADESKADIAKVLEGELDNVVNAADASGSTKVPIDKAEQIKRGYSRKAGNWADPEKGQAGKEMYQTYRKGVEDAATKADPTTAKAFEEGKKSYQLLAPIEEAAERRASTTSQSPVGGLADVTSGIAGFIKGGPLGAVVAPVARRMLAPKMASSIAVTADVAADALRKIPKFAEMEAKNPAMFSAAVSRMTSIEGEAMSKAAEQPAPKGKEKWANDGFKKLLEHSESGDKEILSKNKSSMLEDPKLKELLVLASDLKPGSKAMTQMLSKIKDRIAKAGG